MHGKVFISEAVNWNSPFNRGLVSWWSALPGQQRGNMFRDLCRRNDGTLNGGAEWLGPRGRRGGFGCINFDGSNDYVNIGTPANLDFGTGNFAISCFSRTIEQDITKAIVSRDLDGNPFTALMKPSSNVAQFGLRDLAGNTAAANGTSRIDNGQWHWLFGQRVGQTAEIYVNGKLEGTATNASLGTPYQSDAAWRIGNRASGNLLWNGQIADVRMFNHAWSAEAIAALHQEALAGYPDALNWHRPSRYAFQDEGGGVTGSPWYYYQQLLAG